LPCKITAFQWFLVHGALPVEKWVERQDAEKCKRCRLEFEDQRHALWECVVAQQVWKRILRLIAHVDVEECSTWGGAIWGIMNGPMTLYEASSITTYYIFDRGKVEARLMGNLQVQEEEQFHLRWVICGCSYTVGSLEI
jgi:hypothetical protein